MVLVVFCESCGKELMYFDEDASEFVEMEHCSCGGCELVYCGNCGEKLDDDDIRQVWESRGEFWGAPCSECMVVGYCCHECGWEEEF
jgi:hypothetical protein